MQISEFLKKAWLSYAELAPDAPKIQALLEARGETIINDHVALRTFNLPGITRHDIGALFEKWGYARAGEDLDFPEKKLKASYYQHPDQDLPKIFISELLIEQVSPELQAWIRSLAGNRRTSATAEMLLTPTWGAVKYEDYARFYPESEYAAWTAAFGIRVNHFTVFVNRLKTFAGLAELNAFLRDNGIALNEAGGVIKGTPRECLEQSSTLARKVGGQFAGDHEHLVLGCYYEFARRYPLPGTNTLFQGFIPASANRIFESNFEKR